MQNIRVSSTTSQGRFTTELRDSVAIIQSDIEVTWAVNERAVSIRFDNVSATTSMTHVGDKLTLKGDSVPAFLRPAVNSKVTTHMVHGSNVPPITISFTTTGDWEIYRDDGDFDTNTSIEFPGLNYVFTYFIGM